MLEKPYSKWRSQAKFLLKKKFYRDKRNLKRVTSDPNNRGRLFQSWVSSRSWLSHLAAFWLVTPPSAIFDNRASPWVDKMAQKKGCQPTWLATRQATTGWSSFSKVLAEVCGCVLEECYSLFCWFGGKITSRRLCQVVLGAYWSPSSLCLSCGEWLFAVQGGQQPHSSCVRCGGVVVDPLNWHRSKQQTANY